MKIFKQDSIEDVRTRFNQQYPFLQLEFYSKPHAHYSGSKKIEQLNHNTTLSLLNKELKEVDIPLDDLMSVDALEKEFETKAHLHVQVFRKSADQWLQTTSTDDWSLRKHSETAETLQRYKDQKS